MSMSYGDAFPNHTFVIELGGSQLETVQDVSTVSMGSGGEVTITRGMDQSRAFTDWINETTQNHNLDTARQNIGITVLDAMKQPVRRLQFINAWASKWTGPSLDEAGGSGPALEQVTIVFEDCQVE